MPLSRDPEQGAFERRMRRDLAINNPVKEIDVNGRTRSVSQSNSSSENVKGAVATPLRSPTRSPNLSAPLITVPHQQPFASSVPPNQLPVSSFNHAKEIVHKRDAFQCKECGKKYFRREVDIHHLIPRALGGSDSPSNLITLCDGCHAARHPNLQVSLARRFIEKWGTRLARYLDQDGLVMDSPERLGHALRLLGYSRFREGQLEVVLSILKGESVLVVRPTGAGKTLCFWLPSICSEGTAFVFSPLKALMNQQVANLTKLAIPASFINGDIGPDEKRQRYELLESGALKLMYITPERLDTSRVRSSESERFSKARPSYLVIDEAHCVDRWGEGFRPAYGQIGEYRKILGSPPMLAFTATATIPAQQRILQSLGVPDARVFVADVDRPNIALFRVMSAGKDNRTEVIADLLRRIPKERALIFVPTLKKGVEAQTGLAAHGINLEFYHGKELSASKREFIQKRFQGELEPKINALICTNAFGMGLDIPDIRLVIHWQHPSSVEDYLQEFGRAGRDGNPSMAVVFYEINPRYDVGLLEFMAEKSTYRNKDGLERRKNEISNISSIIRNTSRCFRRQLLECFLDESKAKKKALSMRILSWIFERNSRLTKHRFCCDACNPNRMMDAF